MKVRAGLQVSASEAEERYVLILWLWLNWNFKRTSWEKRVHRNEVWLIGAVSCPHIRHCQGSSILCVFIVSNNTNIYTRHLYFCLWEWLMAECGVEKSGRRSRDYWCLMLSALINAEQSVKGRRFKRNDTIKRGLSPMLSLSSQFYIITKCYFIEPSWISQVQTQM